MPPPLSAHRVRWPTPRKRDRANPVQQREEASICAAVLGISLASKEAPERLFCNTRTPGMGCWSRRGSRAHKEGHAWRRFCPVPRRDWYTSVDGDEGLAGELAEIRAADLRFSEREAGELLAASGIALSEGGTALLLQRTEGWAAGLWLGRRRFVLPPAGLSPSVTRRRCGPSCAPRPAARAGSR
jgi:hypothetical protein